MAAPPSLPTQHMQDGSVDKSFILYTVYTVHHSAAAVRELIK